MGTQSTAKMAISTQWLKWTILLVVVLGQYPHTVDGNTTMSDLKRLLAEKKKDYDKLIRPKHNQSEPLHVSLAFDLIAIRDFDEVAEKFSVIGTIYSIWQDDSMPWEPKKYGDLYTFVVENSDFWTPPFILANAFEKIEKVGIDSYWPIRFYHTGHAVFSPGQVFTTTCSVNVELYPWDTQVCSIIFVVWGHPKEEIIVTPYEGKDKVSLSYYGGNGEWDLVDTTAANIDSSFFQFQFIIKRRPLFILVNTLVPIILMSVLNIMAFLIPISSGERISYCITVLLALAVFLTLISDTMPRSATTIAVLCYYLVCVLALSMLITLASVISMRIYHRGETQEASQCWSAFVRFVRCRWIRNRRTRRLPYEKKATKKPLEATIRHPDGLLYRGKGVFDSRSELSQNRINVISKTINPYDPTSPMSKSRALNIYPEKDRPPPGKGIEYPRTNRQNDFQEDFQDDSNGEEHEEHDLVTWKDVSSTIDIVFFVLAVVVLGIFTGIFFVYTLDSSSK